MTRSSRFKERELANALKGTLRAGLKVAEIKIDATGTVSILTKDADEPWVPPATGPNEWDNAK